MTDKSALGTLVTEWCRQDQDEETRAEIQKLVKEEKEEELEARLGNRKSVITPRRLCFQAFNIENEDYSFRLTPFLR